MLKIRGLKKTFGNTLVLKGVDLDILEGEIVVVVGPSGGGKTTLLRIITGLEKCDDGSIEISGNTLCKDGKYCDKKTANIIRKDVGLVFQSFNLFPHKSVLENIIEAPIRVLGEKKENAINKALEILKKDYTTNQNPKEYILIPVDTYFEIIESSNSRKKTLDELINPKDLSPIKPLHLKPLNNDKNENGTE